jgi:hypothetical protein
LVVGACGPTRPQLVTSRPPTSCVIEKEPDGSFTLIKLFTTESCDQAKMIFIPALLIAQRDMEDGFFKL